MNYEQEAIFQSCPLLFLTKTRTGEYIYGRKTRDTNKSSLTRYGNFLYFFGPKRRVLWIILAASKIQPRMI